MNLVKTIPMHFKMAIASASFVIILNDIIVDGAIQGPEVFNPNPLI